MASTVGPFALKRNGFDGRYDNYLKLTVGGLKLHFTNKRQVDPGERI